MERICQTRFTCTSVSILPGHTRLPHPRYGWPNTLTYPLKPGAAPEREEQYSKIESTPTRILSKMSTMKFCGGCSNILYPKEDKDQKILLYGCRNCPHQEAADNTCLYRNEIHRAVGELTQVLLNVAEDPTLPRTKSVQCAQCKHGEAVFFQATAREEEGMRLFFVCCNPSCGNKWRD